MAPSLVQSATNIGAASPITVTLGSNTTAGNCLIVYVGTGQGTTNPTVSGITLTGSSDTFADAKSLNNNGTVDSEIWTDQGCSGGHTAVVVTFAAGSGASAGMVVRVEEWSGVATAGAVDKTNATATAASTSFTSGSSGTLSQASELVVGAVSQDSGNGSTVTGPASPWTNTTQLNAASASVGMVTGWQVVSATTAQTYSGTIAPSAASVAVIVTLKTPAAAVSGTAQPRATVPVPRRRPGRAVSLIRAVPGVTGTAPRQQYRIPPRRILARAVIRFTPVKTVNQVPPPVPAGTVQPLATIPAPRRKPARAIIRFTAPVIAQLPAGVIQPRATIPAARRKPGRAYVQFTPATTSPVRVVIADDGDAPWHIRSRRRRT